MVVDIPPINIIAIVQSNIIQSLIAVFVAGMIGASRKVWIERFWYAALSIIPAFFTIGVLLELVSSQNWRVLGTVAAVAVGTWITAKEGTVVKKG